MEEALENRFPLLKDLPPEDPRDVPVPNFVQAMAIPVLRDYTKPPPPLPNSGAARLQLKLEQIDRHAAAINHNFHFMTQREARRIADLCDQEEQKMRELNEVDHLPVYGLGGGEDPNSTLDLDVLLNKEPDGGPDRYALPQGLHPRDFEIPPTKGHMPRKVLQIETLSLVRTALNNMEGRAGAAQQQKEAARREASLEVAAKLGQPQPGSTAHLTKEDGEVDKMDTRAG